MTKLRWKKQPKETGLRSVGASPQGYDYHDGTKLYAVVSPMGGHGANPLRGWYWVAGWDSDVPYMNTCDEFVPTPEEAKKEAAQYVKSFLSPAS